MCASHQTDDVRQLAQVLIIELPYIPAGPTDTFQPLKCAIFGAFKSRARQPFRCQAETNRGAGCAKATAVQDLIPAREESIEDVGRERQDFEAE
jgi:hypothetical protein